jgi:epoxide hydrolase-like predicted phosphatase
MEKKIKCIIFDVGGVLVDNNAEDVWKSVNKRLGKNIFFWSKELVEFHKGKPSESAFYNRLAKQYGISPIKLHNMIVYEYRKQVKVKKDVLLIAKRLKKSGYKIAILSNMTPEFKRVNLRRGLFFNFSPVVMSCDVGCKKPHKEIYEIILKKLKLKPEKCLIIDDWPDTINTAVEMNFPTITFKNALQLKRELKKKGIDV